jgi:hypothetical protein
MGALDPRTRSFNCAFSPSRRAIFASATRRAARYSDMDFGCDMECDVNWNLIWTGSPVASGYPTLPLPPRASP